MVEGIAMSTADLAAIDRLLRKACYGPGTPGLTIREHDEGKAALARIEADTLTPEEARWLAKNVELTARGGFYRKPSPDYAMWRSVVAKLDRIAGDT